MKTTNTITTRLLPTILVVAAAMASGTASAATAGKVLFSFGDTKAERNGETIVLRRGSEVQAGDVLMTGASGRLQMRMNDNALFNLRPQTTFKIDEFEMPATAAKTKTTRSTQTVRSSGADGRSFMTLVKGGFRTISGLVGKKDRSAYRIATPVATMGIRGTIYEALYCDPCMGVDASGNAVEEKRGLHVAVLDGAVAIQNSGGEILVKRGEFGFAGSTSSAPAKSDDSPAVFDESGSSDSAPEQAEQPSPVSTAPSSNRGAAFGGSAGTLSTVGDPNLALDASGNVVRFAAPVGNSGSALFEISNAQNVNTGSDAATGLRWGRWEGGTAIVRLADGTVQALDLSNQSLHWVVGPEGDVPNLPKSGTANYDYVGGTNPTSTAGGDVSATLNLQADFTNQAVTSLVNATTSSSNFSAQGTGGINANATFSGAYQVVVDGQAGGEGQFSGFFSGPTGEGAGMSYSISNQDGSEVIQGAGAFERR